MLLSLSKYDIVFCPKKCMAKRKSRMFANGIDTQFSLIANIGMVGRQRVCIVC